MSERTFRHRRDRFEADGAERPNDCRPGRVSAHQRVPDQYCDQNVTKDCADSEIYAAFFVAEEVTISCFQPPLEVAPGKGLFCAPYTDRGNWPQPGVARQTVKGRISRSP